MMECYFDNFINRIPNDHSIEICTKNVLFSALRSLWAIVDFLDIPLRL